MLKVRLFITYFSADNPLQGLNNIKLDK